MAQIIHFLPKNLKNMTEKFELFAIIELFGHNRIAGKVSEQSIGVATFIRVDVPETKQMPSFSKLFHPNAIYAINPVTEEVANEMAGKIESKPIQAWDIQEMQKRLLQLTAKEKDLFDPDE